MASRGFEVEVKREPGTMEQSAVLPNKLTDASAAQSVINRNESIDISLVQRNIISNGFTHLNESVPPLVVKRKLFPSESTGGLLAQTEIISSESNSYESRSFNESFHLNEPTHLNEMAQTVKSETILVESMEALTVKKENDCKTEITYELVNTRLSREEQTLDAPVKTEASIISVTSSSKVKRHITVVINTVASVELIDIFSENDRKQGNAHLMVGPCQCVFCQPEYNRESVSQLVKKNLVSQGRLMSARSHCKVSLPHKYQIIKESWGKNGKKLYTRRCKCPECGVICISSTILEIHMRTHTGERPYECKKCSAKFRRRSHLDSHMRMKHSNARPFKCAECPLAFKDKGDLTKHKKVHSDERPFSCKICGSAFKRDTHLKSHMTKHIEFSERPFKCSLCYLTFTRKNLLNHHMRSHSDENPFKCKECTSAFKTKYLLKKHLIVHGANPFLCNVCGLSFIRKAVLKLHMTLKHDPVRRFTCDICSTAFKSKQCLIEHIYRLHSNLQIAKYKCDICEKKFHTKPAIRSHLICHTSDVDKKFKCEKCPSKFASKYRLRQHSLTHTNGEFFTCGFCFVAFINSRCLSRHIDKYHDCNNEDRKFICSICSAAFKKKYILQNHIRRLHSNKNFRCGKCLKEFKTKETLDRHLKRTKAAPCVLQRYKKLNF